MDQLYYVPGGGMTNAPLEKETCNSQLKNWLAPGNHSQANATTYDTDLPDFAPYFQTPLSLFNPLLACCRRYSRGER